MNRKQFQARKKEVANLTAIARIESQAIRSAILKRTASPRSRSRCRIVASHNPNVIGIWGMIEEETAARFKAAIDRADPRQPLTVRMDSAGGSCLAANSIFDDVKAFPSHTICMIESSALSAAAFIAQAFDERVVRPNGYLMIHNPRFDDGEYEPTTSDISLTEKLTSGMIAVIAKRTRQAVTAVQRMLNAETWLNANEALAGGFVDRIE